MQGAKQAKVTDIGGECCLDLPLGNFQLPSPQLAPICGVVKIPSAETEPSQDAVFEFLSLSDLNWTSKYEEQDKFYSLLEFGQCKWSWPWLDLNE